MSPWAAWVAGMAYGLNPRVISQVGHPHRRDPADGGAAVGGPADRAGASPAGSAPGRAALFSAAAYMFTGALNATATVAILPLVFIIIVWGVRRGLRPARAARLVVRADRASYLGLVGGVADEAADLLAAVLRLRRGRRRHHQDDRLHLGAAGCLELDHLQLHRRLPDVAGRLPARLRALDGRWPAVLLAAIGVLGLVTWRSPWRTPLVALRPRSGMVCLVVGHAAAARLAAGAAVRDLLDGDWDLFRNVTKIDPIVRLPLARRHRRRVRPDRRPGGRRARRRASGGARSDAARGRVGVAGLTFLVLLMAQPAVALNLRTPGWDEVPDYWHQTADYLDDAGGRHAGAGSSPARASACRPGAGPWTSRCRRSRTSRGSPGRRCPWCRRRRSGCCRGSRSSSPPAPGSPNLGAMLARLGISDIVVRHDLDPTLAEATSINLVSIAMARSEGVTREATFGEADFGPAIEIFSVDDDDCRPDLGGAPRTTR